MKLIYSILFTLIGFAGISQTQLDIDNQSPYDITAELITTDRGCGNLCGNDACIPAGMPTTIVTGCNGNRNAWVNLWVFPGGTICSGTPCAAGLVNLSMYCSGASTTPVINTASCVGPISISISWSPTGVMIIL